jgi:hypothetical protein
MRSNQLGPVLLSLCLRNQSFIGLVDDLRCVPGLLRNVVLVAGFSVQVRNVRVTEPTFFPREKPSFLFNDFPKTIQTALARFLFLTPSR